MSRFLSLAGAAVDRIKINRVTRELVAGRPVWVKRRTPVAGPILACANRFFRVVGNPVQAIRDPAEWQRWEAGCYQLVHAGAFQIEIRGREGIAVDEIPGRDLSLHLTKGSLTHAMLASAGRELCRAHGLESAEFQSLWSHGDPHAGNFIYEDATDRARLMDFEVKHDLDLPAAERQADDLLVLLQDLMGRIAADRWVPAAQAFLDGYGRGEIIAKLRERLHPPRGLARLWWAVRTTYLHPTELARRIQALRNSLAPHPDFPPR